MNVKEMKVMTDIIKIMKEQTPHEEYFNFCTSKEIKRQSVNEVYQAIKHIALGLSSRGVKKGDMIGLMAPSCPNWTIFDLAFMSIGVVTIPLFETASKDHLLFQFKQTKMKKLFIAELGFSDKMTEVLEEASLEVFSFKSEGNLPEYNSMSFVEDLIEEGKKLSEEQPGLFESFLDAVKPDDLMTIIYTSGTTGLPKGVVLNHSNFVHQMKACDEILGCVFVKDYHRTACVLPLAHIYERTLTYFFLVKKASVYYVNPKEIPQVFPVIKPEMTVVVPRLLERVFDKLMTKKSQANGIEKMLLGLSFSRALNRDIFSSKGIMDFIYDKLVYSKIRQILGGEVKIIISGGAALPTGLFRFFRNAGIPLDQGYGLTETSPIVSTTYLDKVKVGSVGLPLPGVEVKISEEGEVLIRGANVMQGYFQNEEETKKDLQDGWFFTGDLGRLDEDGYLYITGRKKELLKSSNGKYIAPVPIEEKIARNPLLEYVMVLGDAQKFVSALLFPNFETLKSNKEKRNLSHLSDEEFFKDETVVKEIKKTINRVNEGLSPWEKVSQFRIVIQKLSVESGEITPKLSMRRNVIKEKFKSFIDNIYREDEKISQE